MPKVYKMRSRGRHWRPAEIVQGVVKRTKRLPSMGELDRLSYEVQQWKKDSMGARV